MDLGRAIRVVMTERALSLKDIQSMTGWGIQYISHARNNKVNAEARLSQWAEALGVTPSELVQRAEQYGEQAA